MSKDNSSPFHRGDEGAHAGAYDTGEATSPDPDHAAALPVDEVALGVHFLDGAYRTILALDDRRFVLDEQLVVDLHWQAGSALGIITAFALIKERLDASDLDDATVADLTPHGLEMRSGAESAGEAP